MPSKKYPFVPKREIHKWTPVYKRIKNFQSLSPGQRRWQIIRFMETHPDYSYGYYSERQNGKTKIYMVYNDERDIKMCVKSSSTLSPNGFRLCDQTGKLDVAILELRDKLGYWPRPKEVASYIGLPSRRVSAHLSYWRSDRALATKRGKLYIDTSIQIQDSSSVFNTLVAMLDTALAEKAKAEEALKLERERSKQFELSFNIEKLSPRARQVLTQISRR